MVNVSASISMTVLAVSDEPGWQINPTARETVVEDPPNSALPVHLVLQLEKETYLVGERVHIDLRLENRSGGDIPLKPFRYVSFRGVDQRESRQLVTKDETAWENAIIAMGQGGLLAKGGYIGLKKFGGFTFQQPGRFVLWLTHYGPGCPRGIRSNALQFTVCQ